MARLQGDLKERTMALAERVLALADRLPNNTKGWVVGKQLLRCGTSVGANVREADHALTDAEFSHKCSIARKEASETCYWLDLCQRAGVLSGELLIETLREADEITRVLSTIVRRTQCYLREKQGDRDSRYEEKPTRVPEDGRSDGYRDTPRK